MGAAAGCRPNPVRVYDEVEREELELGHLSWFHAVELDEPLLDPRETTRTYRVWATAANRA